jgi:hypothetical protein
MLKVSQLAIIKLVAGSASPGLMSGRSGMSPISAVADSTLWLTVRITAVTAWMAASAGMPETTSPDFEIS